MQSQIGNIIKVYINENFIYIENGKLHEDLANANNIKIFLINKEERIINYYIVHSSIIDIIKSYLSINEWIIFKPIKFYIKDNKIFFYYNKCIIIGNINENHIFNSNTIISYKSLDILSNEKKIS